MSFKLTIETGNAAFEGDALTYALAECLKDVACEVQACRMSGQIRDTNGNTVGEFDTATDDDCAPEGGVSLRIYGRGMFSIDPIERHDLSGAGALQEALRFIASKLANPAKPYAVGDVVAVRAVLTDDEGHTLADLRNL